MKTTGEDASLVCVVCRKPEAQWLDSNNCVIIFYDYKFWLFKLPRSSNVCVPRLYLTL
jgi:hypothetical protein